MASKSIKVDKSITREGICSLKTIEQKSITIPSASGKGKAVVQIEAMAELMKEVYEQTQQLISATATMIDVMYGALIDADEVSGVAIKGKPYHEDIFKGPMDDFRR